MASHNLVWNVKYTAHEAFHLTDGLVTPAYFLPHLPLYLTYDPTTENHRPLPDQLPLVPSHLWTGPSHYLGCQKYQPQEY